jgi:hypothetical protein
MSIQKISITLASVLVMAAGVPAFANTVNTSSTTQDNRQTNVVSGNGSSGINVSRQDASTSQSGLRTDNLARTSQSNDQFNRISGNGSSGINVNEQRGVTIQRR